MQRPRIALLNASHRDANTSRNFRRECRADLAEFDVTAGQLPATFDFDAVIITGSKSSVYWDEPWIPPLKDWVGAAIDRDLPVLGVCYGHQLVADVLGGTVEPMGEYELGYRTVRHAGNSALFDGVDEEFVVFTSHSDAVTELPQDATITATNDKAIQGFQLDRAFGIQFHPEYDKATSIAITEEKDLPRERIDAVLEGITPDAVAAAHESKAIFDNFDRIIDRVRTPA